MSRTEEKGQASTAFLLSFTFVLLLVAMMAIPHFAKAGTERTGLDGSADAAALAGAQRVQELMPQIVDAYAQSYGVGGLVGSTGSDAAISFAQRNGSHVTEYEYTPGNGMVTVSVRSNAVQENGEQNLGRAVADSGFSFGGGCSFDVVPPPSPSAVPGHMWCGGKPIDIMMDNLGKVTVISTPEEIKSLLVGDRRATLVK